VMRALIHQQNKRITCGEVTKIKRMVTALFWRDSPMFSTQKICDMCRQGYAIWTCCWQRTRWLRSS
jgi:hypothetical protein